MTGKAMLQEPMSVDETPAVAPEVPEMDELRLRETTAEIAYGLYEKRGRVDGSDLDDWLEAERIAREQLLSKGA